MEVFLLTYFLVTALPPSEATQASLKVSAAPSEEVKRLVAPLEVSEVGIMALGAQLMVGMVVELEWVNKVV